MNDPFFDEDDDGDFDDLYGAPSGSRTQASARPAVDLYTSDAQQPQLAAGGWGDADGGAYSYSASPASSAPSTTTSRSGAVTRGDSNSRGVTKQPTASSASATAEATASDKMPSTQTTSSAAARRGGTRTRKTRRKGSEELFDVDWEDDDAVDACSKCASAFSLLKRKHHCRHCGRVMCSDCSVFRYFEISRKKHRVCTACNTVLAQANRLGDSDAESIERSNATDDGVSSSARATPERKRGKLRANLKKTFAGKDAKPQATPKATRAETLGSDTRQTNISTRVANSDASRNAPSDDLFDVADDTWFTDPQDSDSRAATAAVRAVRSTTYDPLETSRAAAPLPSRTAPAANEWYDETNRTRHTIGAPVPRRTPPDMLAIDVYESRDSDDLALRRPRMEMPRPALQIAPVATSLVPVAPPRATAVTPDATMQDPSAAHARQPSTSTTLRESIRDILHIHSKRSGESARCTPREDALPVASVRPELATVPTRTHERHVVAVGPAQPTVVTQVRPTFYDADVDDLVVDDSPGYFDRSTRDHGVATASLDARRTVALDSSSWGGALMPSTVAPRAVMHDSESYSIVETPVESGGDHELSAAQQPKRDESGSAESSAAAVTTESNGRGLTGALKRLFGISGAKPSDRQQPPAATGRDAPPETPSHADAIGSDQLRAVGAVGAQSGQHRESQVVYRVDSFDRYSMAERSFVSSSDASAGAGTNARYSMVESSGTTTTAAGSAFAVSSSRSASYVEAAPTLSGAFTSREPSTRSRRDTFDDLFASPTGQSAASAGGGSGASSALPSRAWGGVSSTYVVPTTGIDRFDQRRDEADAFRGQQPEAPSTALTPAVYAIHRSRSSSIGLGESSLASQKESARAPGSAWRSVTPEPSYGVATYAVPSGIGTDRFASSRSGRDDDGSAQSMPPPPSSIMDAITRRDATPVVVSQSTSRRANSVDDLFAAFERPSEYVYDAASGGYVATTAVPARSYASAAVMRESHSQVYEPRTRVESRDTGGTGLSADAVHVEPSSVQSTAAVAAGGYSADTVATADDELDDTIVDKISSLEGELAALKRLIRQRKDHEQPSRGTMTQTAPRGSLSSTGSRTRGGAKTTQTRKLSIFDHDSSDDNDEDDGLVAHKPRTRRSAARKTGVEPPVSPIQATRASQRKTAPQKRRDSFADLFEDAPAAPGLSAGIGGSGGGGYESLFQTGSGHESSSEQEDATPHHGGGRSTTKASSAGARRERVVRVSSESDDVGAAPSSSLAVRSAVTQASYDDDDDDEMPSLKHRSRNRGARASTKSSVRATTSGGIFSDSDEDAAPVVMSAVKALDVKPRTKAGRVTKQPPAMAVAADPIDALFDSSSERDVASFFDVTEPNGVRAELERVDSRSAAHQIERTRGSGAHDELTAATMLDESDSDEDLARSLARAKQLRRSQSGALEASAAAAVTTVAVAAVEPPVVSQSERDDDKVDSDDEFASILAANRVGSGITTRAVESSVSAATRSLASESAVPAPVDIIDDAHVAAQAGDSDDESAGQQQQQQMPGTTSRGKSVTFAEEHSGSDADEHVTAKATVLELETATTDVSELALSVDVEASRADLHALAADEHLESVSALAIAADNADEDDDAIESARSESHTLLNDSARSVPITSSSSRNDAVAAVSVAAPSSVVHSPAAWLANDDDDVTRLFDASSGNLYSAVLGTAPSPTSSRAAANIRGATDGSDDDSEIGEVDDDDTPAFSFEVAAAKKPRAKPAGLSLLDLAVPTRRTTYDDDADDSSTVVVLGKYAAAPVASPSHPPLESVSSDDTVVGTSTGDSASASGESVPLAPLLPVDSDAQVDADWQQLQAQDKARRKKLQFKQRQAQREKLLKKQGGGSGSARQVSAGAGSTASAADANSGATGGEKPRKKTNSKKERAAAAAASGGGDAANAQSTASASSTSSRKKSSASRKHKHRVVGGGEEGHGDGDGEYSNENVDASASTLTEL